MRATLRQRCETQIRNEEMLRKGHMLQLEEMIKLGGITFANAGRPVDTERIARCKQILKERVGIFSSFRGYMQYLVLIKMALADNPETYIDNVLGIYQRLKGSFLLPGELVAMAATTIYENCPAEKVDEVVDKTREAYAKIKQSHPFFTGEEDMALIALMIMAGKDPDRAAAEAEELYLMVKDGFWKGSDVPQAVAMVLALSDKPPAQKVADYFALFEACKEAGRKTSKDKAAVIYAAFADLDADRAGIVAEIGEVDDWLRHQKGYGPLGVGASMRRMFAATLVLEDRQAGSSSSAASTTNAVAQAVVEELMLILISIIVTTIVVNAIVSSGH